MKKILIIEDDQIVANVYRNKLAVDGYQTEAALDGESGLALMRTFQPDAIVLDLMLPKMSGLEVIKEIRGEAKFSKLPIIVLSNTYSTNLIQEAWKAGVTNCVSKINCTPKVLLDLMHRAIGPGEPVSHARRTTDSQPAAKPAASGKEADAATQAEFRKTFIAGLPATRNVLRAAVQSLIKSDTEEVRLKQIQELYGTSMRSTATPASPASFQSHTWPPRSKRCSRSFMKNRKASTFQRCAPSPSRWIFLTSCLNAAPSPKNGMFPPPGFWSWMTRPLPAAPSFTHSRRRSSGPSASKTRTPPSNCFPKIITTSCFSTWTCRT